MAGKGTIGGKIVLEGAQKYKEDLKNIKSSQAELRSEMMLCRSKFKESENSLSALKEKYRILTQQVNVQTEKTNIYRKAIQESGEKEKQAAQNVDAMRTALADAEQKMKEMEESTDGTSGSMEEQAKAVEELKSRLALAEQDYAKAARTTESYQTSLNYAEAELQELQRELEQTGRHVREAEDSTDHCAHSLDEFGREAAGAAENTSVFGDVLKAELLSGAIQAGVTAIAEGIKTIASAAVESGSSFEASMSQVAATMGMTAQDVENGSEAYTMLADAAKECGKSTMFSASQAGEALNYLALAGYDAAKAAATLPKVLDLAAAGGLDLAYASDLATDSMAALGMETGELDNYIDEMARTSQKSNTSVAQLGEATLVCAGTVSLAGQSLETMNTHLGVMANNGIKGAEGGTHYRNVILSLISPTESASIALNKLGVNVSDNSGNMRDLNDILTDMNASMSGMASEEKTQMISRIFNKTDIAAVNALLKGTGKEYNNLHAEISDCSGAAAAMAETLNNNLKGKVTILQSALEGLGISAYEIFDDDMKGAVDEATKAVGRLQQSIDSGNLGLSLNRLSDAAGEFMEKAIGVGEDALPVMIDGLTWLIDNVDLIISGLTGIAAANVQMKVVTPAVEMMTAAWRAYKLENEGATISQWLLNAAMNANPAGALLTVMTALTAAMAAFVFINRDNAGVMDETTRATRDLIEESKYLSDSYASSAAERKTARESMGSETEACKKLVEELKGLQENTRFTVDEQVRMESIVMQLNKAMPELNLSIDEQTGRLNMSTRALEDNIEAMMAMEKVNAAREDQKRIAEEQYEAEKNLADLEKQLAEQKKDVLKAQEELNASIEEYGIMGVVEAQVLEQAKMAEEELTAQKDAAAQALERLKEEYAEVEEYISDTEPITAAAEAVDDLGGAADETGARISEMSAEAQEAFTEMYDSVAETVTNQMNLFDEFDVKTELSKEKLLSNMESQIAGITQWSDNMKTLAERGIDQRLLQKLAEMGPEGAGYVATFVSMTDEELQKANELFEQSLVLPDATASSVADSYLTAGQMAAEGFKQGIQEKAGEAADSSGEMAEEALNETKKVLDTNSPSKETEKIGKYYDEGFSQGIRKGKQEVLDTVSSLMAEVIRTTRVVCQTNTFSDIGKQIPAGLAAGIRSGKSDVVNAIRDLCTAAVYEAKKDLDINSPSRKFQYLGEMSGEGYISGWKSSMANIDAVIAASMPEASMGCGTGGTEPGWKSSEPGGRVYHIDQNINIYSKTDDLIETTRKFRQSQKEAATEW